MAAYSITGCFFGQNQAEHFSFGLAPYFHNLFIFFRWL